MLILLEGLLVRQPATVVNRKGHHKVVPFFPHRVRVLQNVTLPQFVQLILVILFLPLLDLHQVHEFLVVDVFFVLWFVVLADLLLQQFTASDVHFLHASMLFL